MRSKSLSFRLLIAEGLVLAAFFTLVAVILEQGFRESVEQALKDRLQVQVYALLSAAKLNDAGELTMPARLYEPRFANPGSGLYGFIQLARSRPVWRSASAIGLEEVVAPADLALGESKFVTIKHDRYALHSDIILKNAAGVSREFVFTVTEDGQFVSSKVAHLEEVLRVCLLVIGLVLVLIQFALLRWSLKPLRSIVKDLDAIEQGNKTLLDGQYASELEGLAGNLNAFISHERAHLERYRNNLADLAHSLKTPLAILHGCVGSFAGNQVTVQEQISRMNQIVEYQLHKAAAKGGHNAIKTVDIAVVILKIKASLDKVYKDKGIAIGLAIPESCPIYCEEGDVYEIVGNLMDNACKWCQHSVKVSIALNHRAHRRNYSVLLQIEDDGPGIPVGKFNDILKRGIRADENIHGHGIGVSVVNELVGLLGGKLEGGKSVELGGMRWSVYLP
ncbi:MAG: ATP-binding protein [Methylococcales bacterium]|nr:ATP-binding protein [Methylococcales bacterium]